MKPFYELLPKNAYYQISYEMSVAGSFLNQLMEKHGMSPRVINTKSAAVDWGLEGFPETPVDVIRTISGKLYREAGFVHDLKDHWREASDTLEEASIVFHIYCQMQNELDENDSSSEMDYEDEDLEEYEDEDPDAKVYLGTWRYSLHDLQNEIRWIGTDGKPAFHSESAVCHVPAKETRQIEYAGKAIQILPETIVTNVFPFLKQVQDGNYLLALDIPSRTSFIAADGLEVTFLWDLFLEQYEKIFSLISCISSIAYNDDVSSAIAESDLFWKLPYGNRDLRVFAGCREYVITLVKDFLFFSQDLNDGFRMALQEAADHMIRKKNGKLSTTRVWSVSRKTYEAAEECPFSIGIDCRPVSENEANLRLSFKVKTPEGETGSVKLMPSIGRNTFWC